jgi:hypothetical protein
VLAMAPSLSRTFLWGCHNKLEIYYDVDGEDLEIAGVFASVENWREILLPLLEKWPS